MKKGDHKYMLQILERGNLSNFIAKYVKMYVKWTKSL